MSVYYLIPLAGALVMSLAMLLSKLILRRTNTGTFLFFRSFSGLVFSLFLLSRLELGGKSGGEYGLLLLSVLLVPFLMNALFFHGVQLAGVGIMTAILQTTPAFVVVWELLLFGRLAPLQALVGTAIILGAARLILSDTEGSFGRKALLFGLGAASINALYLALLPQVILSFSKSVLMVAQNVAFVVMSSWLFWGRKRVIGISRFPGWGIISLCLLSGILVRVFYFFLRLTSVDLLGSLVTSSVTLSQIPLTLLLSHLLFVEEVSRRKWIASGLILAGALLVATAHYQSA